MCEQFVVNAEEPFRLGDLWALAEGLERYGIAGFGWGVAWVDREGRIGSHRDVRAFRDDPSRSELGAVGDARGTGAPAPALEAVDGDHGRHAAVRGPERAVRVRTQR